MSATSGYRLHHTMIRARDPVKTQHFYQDLLGMTLLMKKDFEAGKFSLYFYGYLPEGEKKKEFDNDADLMSYVFSFRGHCVEITHNWGTENDESFEGYHNGNKDPRGFGHLAIVVPDVDEAVKRLEDAGVKILKRSDGGTMKGIAFVEDPDGYWIEIIPDGWDGTYNK